MITISIAGEPLLYHYILYHWISILYLSLYIISLLFPFYGERPLVFQETGKKYSAELGVTVTHYENMVGPFGGTELWRCPGTEPS